MGSVPPLQSTKATVARSMEGPEPISTVDAVIPYDSTDSTISGAAVKLEGEVNDEEKERLLQVMKSSQSRTLQTEKMEKADRAIKKRPRELSSTQGIFTWHRSLNVPKHSSC